MRRKHMLSLFMLVMGVALLVAATTVAVATSATSHTATAAKASAKRGGVLRVNQSGTDFDTVDPGLAYVTNDWALLYTTQVLLVNYPEKNGQAGGQLYPEGATSFPIVSNNGKTYTFHIRPGLKFSDGTPVTAAAWQRAWERNLSPKMGSPMGVNDQFQKVIVGAEAFNNGKASRISGISAHGLTLVFHLTKPNPTFTSYLAMQWFGAVKPNMPYTTQGLNVYPSAGPYYIASREPNRTTVLKRNPYYHGSRPANPDQIVITSNTDVNQSLLQVKAGQADLDMGGVPSTAAASLGQQYGVNKGRFHVGSTSCVDYLLLNTVRAPTNNVAVRKALNWGIDRPALLRILGKYAGQRSDQILVPGVPGYRPYKIYAWSGANVAKAKAVGGSALKSAGTFNVLHTPTPARTAQAQVVEYNLQKLGLKYNDVPTPGTTYYNTLETKGTSYNIARAGWCADYFDPFDYINVLLDGRSIQQTNNVDMAYLNSPALNKQMDQAAALSGRARANAYAKLDLEVMQKYAPWVPFMIDNTRYLTSSRVSNWVYSTYFGEPDLNALAVG
ncbi:MAG TPA: ABC transporter substrate-binding protein [Gaiellaceae bacterium]|nr:ABC transporter substrate-binding protein [Gaiellaceae bacterium]